jgi:hypothetical protein
METDKLTLTKRLLFSVEDATTFNSARLLLLLETLRLSEMTKDAIDLERLCYYDFFAANPFLILESDDPERLQLEVEGFEPDKLEYLTSRQRYRTKRLQIKQYLAVLASKGLITVENSDKKIVYGITYLGLEISSRMNSLYAAAYRKSVLFVVKRLKRFSDPQLNEQAIEWLQSKSFEFDLIEQNGSENDGQNQD